MKVTHQPGDPNRWVVSERVFIAPGKVAVLVSGDDEVVARHWIPASLENDSFDGMAIWLVAEVVSQNEPKYFRIEFREELPDYLP